LRKLVPILILLMLAATLTAHAEGKITTDPNAPGASAVDKDKEALKSDPRLAQKVTYSTARSSVRVILDDLTKSTGVKFIAGYNVKDWQVRDRKMAIFAKDLPLNELMSSMARVMKFKWERGGNDGEWTYRLFMDRKSLLDAESQRQREEQRLDQEATKKRANAMMELGKASSLNPADLEKLRNTNPFLYFVGKSGMGNSMGSFFRESPVALEALASGQRLDLQASSLSPAGQAGVLQAIQAIGNMQAKLGGGKYPVPDDLAANIGQVKIQMNKSYEEAKGMPGAQMLLGDISMSYKDKTFDAPIIDPESNFAKLIGKVLVECDEQNKPINEVMQSHQSEFMTALMTDIKKDQPVEEKVERPDDPAFKTKVKYKAKSTELKDVEQALAEASNIAVVSDSFGMGITLGDVKEQDTELEKALDKIGDTYIYNWDKHADVIEFRDKNWFKKRAAQIPDEWIEGWKQELKSTSTLEIGSLSQIAVLTQEQIMVNISADEMLRESNLFSSIFGCREMLRLYAQLNDSQRAAMFSEGGLDLSTLTADQWPQAEKLISSKNLAYLNDQNARIIITGTREKKDKSWEYKFKGTTSAGLDPIEWRFTAPTYTPPPPPKADDGKKEK